MRIWDVLSGQIVATLYHEKPVNGVAWSYDGTRLATASDDGLARIWDIATQAVIAHLTGHQGGVWSVAWRPDDVWLATASTDGVVRVFQTDFQEILQLAKENQQHQLTPIERAKFLGELLPAAADQPK